VHTALAGRVTFAATLAGRGVVVVDHGATRTTYEPVAARVRVGDVVARGQPIGSLELAGSHCLPAACLHWGWRRGATYLDPLLLVGAGPIVLLPLWQTTPVVGVAPPFLPPPIRRLGGVPPPRERSPVERTASEHRRTGPVWHRPLAMRPLLL
jgi:murein DD-endopeptidase MepM/ murein hydrolase activator NlpD